MRHCVRVRGKVRVIRVKVGVKVRVKVRVRVRVGIDVRATTVTTLFKFFNFQVIFKLCLHKFKCCKKSSKIISKTFDMCKCCTK